MTMEELYIKLARKVLSDAIYWHSQSPDGPFKENRAAIINRLKPLIEAYENEDNLPLRKKLAEAIIKEFQ